MAFEINFTAFRHAQWGGDTDQVWIDFAPDDWSDAAFEWIFADEPGGTPLIALSNADAGNQGVSASYDADMMHPTKGSPIGGTHVVPQIDETTFEGLDDPTPGSADIVLHHTLYVTPSGQGKSAECYGTLTIKQGAPS